ncbi:MAG: hypothetical protein VW338_17295, partial [Rhodospirillaceae bacterium]
LANSPTKLVHLAHMAASDGARLAAYAATSLADPEVPPPPIGAPGRKPLMNAPGRYVLEA